MYFEHCQTADEIRKEYYRLAKLHHPDKGGNTATMQAINSEYADAMAAAVSSRKHVRHERTEHRWAPPEYTDPIPQPPLQQVIDLMNLFRSRRNTDIIGEIMMYTLDNDILKPLGFTQKPTAPKPRKVKF